MRCCRRCVGGAQQLQQRCCVLADSPAQFGNLSTCRSWRLARRCRVPSAAAGSVKQRRAPDSTVPPCPSLALCSCCAHLFILITSFKPLVCCNSVLWLEMDWLNLPDCFTAGDMFDTTVLSVHMLSIFSLCVSLFLYFFICTSCTIFYNNNRKSSYLLKITEDRDTRDTISKYEICIHHDR